MAELIQTNIVTSELGKTDIEVKLNKINFKYSIKIYFRNGLLDTDYVEMLQCFPILLWPDKVNTILDPGTYKIEIWSEKVSCCKCP